MINKTILTPEDVGRTFETSKDGVTAIVKKFDEDDNKFPVLIDLSNGARGWYDANGNSIIGYTIRVFPSRPVEEQLSDSYKEKYDELVDKINELQKKYDENGYDCLPTVKLQRIDSNIESTLNYYSKRSEPSQSTIDSEVEELARELFINSIELVTTEGFAILSPEQSFDYAESFIKFRNERRASHGKP